LDGKSLRLSDLPGVFAGRVKVKISPAVKKKLTAVRKKLEKQFLSKNSPVAYGINTGVGRLKDWRLSPEKQKEFQRNLIVSHSAGVGDNLSPEVTRLVLLFRANSLLTGFSGVRPQVPEKLLEFLNADLLPAIPSVGSLGASGDLAPLAQVAACLLGEPQVEVFYRGRKLSASSGMKKAGIKPLELEAKEALSFINGTAVSLALAAFVLHRAQKLLKISELVAALSLEAIRGELSPFDPRLNTARRQKGQMEVAREILRFVSGSQRMSEAARMENLPDERVSKSGKTPRVQDAYSFRCIPQVCGSVLDTLAFAEGVVQRELNAATDNPLIFEEKGNLVSLSGGNFHAEPLALAADFMGIALCEIANMAERRLFSLLSPLLSFGLKPELTGGEPGLHSGLMLAQYTAAARVAENRVLAHPASVDNITTAGNQEDHVSLAVTAGLKAQKILENTEEVVGLELLAAAQGIDVSEPFLKNYRLGKVTGRLHTVVRGKVPFLNQDRYLGSDIKKGIELVRSEEIASLAMKG
ncbi:MAG: histidine ammonia-lyase, partial [candidate division Zixibacteria bacterium]|nr:histidine ammonia-lyase [candidate division Zixibacteria bacterium]